MTDMQLRLESDAVSRVLDPRQASLVDRISQPFVLAVWAMSRDHDLDLDSVVGRPASFSYAARGRSRVLHGACVHAEHTGTEEQGLSTYVFEVKPRLALLAHRTDRRVFQNATALDIATAILERHDVVFTTRIHERHPPLDMRVQYGETDLVFLQRLLDRHGIAYYFEHSDSESTLVLDDAPHRREALRELPHVDSANVTGGHESVEGLRVRRQHHVRRYRIRSHDFRRPLSYDLAAHAGDEEELLEHAEYAPGAFYTAGHEGGDTPSADDRTVVRGDEQHGQRLADVELERRRSEGWLVDFHTTCLDLIAGSVIRVRNHPRRQLQEPLLLRECRVELYRETESAGACTASLVEHGFRPPTRHAQPRAEGLESATVVGPVGNEIHTDEFGRVRVQFHWDREGNRDEGSSCWVRVGQASAGAGFGHVAIPRIGQEVIVGFFGGDPDHPVILGQLFNGTHPPPYRLPDNRTRSVWRSRSTPSSDGYNEISFEDRAGEEQIFIRAERDLLELVRRDETHQVQGQRRVRIDGACSRSIGGEQREETTGDWSIVAHAKLSRKVEGREDRLNTDDLRITAQADVDHFTWGVERRLIEQDRHFVVRGESRELFVGKRSLSIDGGWHIDSARELTARTESFHVAARDVAVVDAASGITLSCGGSFISISPNEVAITAPLIRLNSGGSAGSVVASDASAPEDARPAEPVDG